MEIQKNVGNQSGDSGNQDGNLSIAIKMIQKSNGSDKFKEWGEVKIIEDKRICKNVVSHL